MFLKKLGPKSMWNKVDMSDLKSAQKTKDMNKQIASKIQAKVCLTSVKKKMFPFLAGRGV